jgi:hypothetical protein
MNFQVFADKLNFLKDFTHLGSIENDNDKYLGSPQHKEVPSESQVELQQLVYLDEAKTAISNN